MRRKQISRATLVVKTPCRETRPHSSDALRGGTAGPGDQTPQRTKHAGQPRPVGPPPVGGGGAGQALSAIYGTVSGELGLRPSAAASKGWQERVLNETKMTIWGLGP